MRFKVGDMVMVRPDLAEHPFDSYDVSLNDEGEMEKFAGEIGVVHSSYGYSCQITFSKYGETYWSWSDDTLIEPFKSEDALFKAYVKQEITSDTYEALAKELGE